MLSPVFRKQFVELVQKESGIYEILDVLEILLILMQKFGKQLAQSPIKEFAKKHYPEAFALYELLGGIRVDTKDLRELQNALYDTLEEKVLRIQTNDAKTLQKELSAKDLLISEGSNDDNPSLRVSSSSKVYKRSFFSDLEKMFH